MKVWRLFALASAALVAAAAIVVLGESASEDSANTKTAASAEQCVAAASCVKTFSKEIIKAGDGGKRKPVKGERVTVHCTGYGKDGDLTAKFWSTRDNDQPFSFHIGLGNVIPAWDEGVLDMELGETAMLTAHPSYAYGEQGFPAWGILPNSVLKFEIQVLKIGV